MIKSNKTIIANKFSKTIRALQIDITKDTSWPVIAAELLKYSNEDEQISFWEWIECYFIHQEKKIGHCHKGQIYWKLSLLYLQKGDITKCLELLEKSAYEDKILNPNIFSASIGMISILKPVLTRYKDGKSWIFDHDMNAFYTSLNSQEKRDFAKDFFEVHDMAATGSISVIKDDFFGFIDDPKKRQVTFDTYREVRDIITNTNLSTYYSCLFSMGSILEGMLDDLFERDNQKVWSLFHNNPTIQADVQKASRIEQKTFNSGMTLGEKIKTLILMAKHNKPPMPKHSILQMRIIGEYRDLIHPRRRLDSPYKPNKYVALFLFTMISKFAGHWWQENINEATLEASQDPLLKQT